MDLWSHLEAYSWQSVQIHQYTIDILYMSVLQWWTPLAGILPWILILVPVPMIIFEVFKYLIKLSAMYIYIYILGCWVGTRAGSTTGEWKRAKLSSFNSNMSSNAVNLRQQSQGMRYSEACPWSCMYFRLQNQCMIVAGMTRSNADSARYKSGSVNFGEVLIISKWTHPESCFLLHGND